MIIALFISSLTAVMSAQDYKEKITKDSIKISYKWRKDKILKKDSPHVLMLEIENLSKSKLTVSFNILFYWKAQLHSSSNTKKYCIKPGKRIQGKKHGLAFHSNVFTLNDYFDPMFSWIIDDLIVEINESCNQRLNLKLKPAYP